MCQKIRAPPPPHTDKIQKKNTFFSGNRPLIYSLHEMAQFCSREPKNSGEKESRPQTESSVGHLGRSQERIFLGHHMRVALPQ